MVSSANTSVGQSSVGPVDWLKAPARSIAGSAAVLPDGTTLVWSARLGTSAGGLALVVESRTTTGGAFSAATTVMTVPIPWVPRDVPVELAVSPDGTVIATWGVIERKNSDGGLSAYSAVYKSGAWTSLPALERQVPMAVRWADDGKARLLTRTSDGPGAMAYVLESSGWALIATQTERDWPAGVIGPQGNFALMSGYYAEEPPGAYYAVLEGTRWTGTRHVPAPLNLSWRASLSLQGTSPFALALNYAIGDLPYFNFYTLTAATHDEVEVPDLGEGCCISITSNERQRLTIFRQDDDLRGDIKYAQTSDLRTWTVHSVEAENSLTLADYVGLDESQLLAVIGSDIYLTRNGELVPVRNDAGFEDGITSVADGSGETIAFYTVGYGAWEYRAPLERIGLTELTTLQPPGPVSSLAAKAAKGIIVVTWLPPRDPGSRAVSRYEYQVDNGAWTSTRVPRLTLRKVPKGVRVTVSVRAVNSVGYGPTMSVTARGR